MAQNTETPTDTLIAATHKDALPADQLTLVGTFEKVDGATALIRSPNGKMRMIAVGDAVGASVVTAIEMGALHLARGTHSRKLTLPEG